MFVGQTLRVVILLELLFKDILKDVLKEAIIVVQNSVLRGKNDRYGAFQTLLQAAPRKTADRILLVVHSECAEGLLEGVYWKLLGLALLIGVEQLDSAGLGELEVEALVLVSERVTRHHNRLLPAGDELWNVGANDGLAEDSSVEEFPDCSVRRGVLGLQVKLLDASVVVGDGSTLDAHLYVLDGLGRVDGHLVFRHIPVLDRQVEVLHVQVQITEDQLLLDLLPHHARHLVAIDLDHRVLHQNLLADVFVDLTLKNGSIHFPD